MRRVQTQFTGLAKWLANKSLGMRNGLFRDSRRRMKPFEELAELDQRVKLAERDEERRCFDCTCHPKPPHPREEGVTSRDGSEIVDIMADRPPVTVELGPTDTDVARDGLPELDFDGLKEVDIV